MELSFFEQRRPHGQGYTTPRDTSTHHIGPRVVLLVFMLLTCSVLDALFTLFHIQQGGSEVNPVMAWALAYGPTSFMGVKMALTGIGVVVLAAHRRFRLGQHALHALALVYLLLLLYHLLNFLVCA